MAREPFFTAIVGAAFYDHRETTAIVSEHLRDAFRQAGGGECDIVMVAVGPGDGEAMVNLIHAVTQGVGR